ncbi:hypothetical protein [Phaeobacter sp. J2-8]|uniref:hypothetical protein n=1 Tax=Phaeobacter sp. J2-8 TaxID=2931394 RepID=UPI001FD5B937|nr:hypothetical protein [Phaeobacter sp. J2-8]MCJ7872666.1 hypothetical protein [Phaeobacter sp. J2-8]
MAAHAKEKLVDEIINDALGSLSDWNKPEARPSVGPKFPELAEQFSQDIQGIKQELRGKLSKRSFEDLKKSLC